MFKCVKTLIGSENQPPILYLNGTAGEEIKEGEGLVLTDGFLTKATTKPKYISLKNQTGGVVPVVLVTPYCVFECEATADPSEFVVGGKLALSADGLNVGAVSTTGGATCFDTMSASAIGDKLQVIFE